MLGNVTRSVVRWSGETLARGVDARALRLRGGLVAELAHSGSRIRGRARSRYIMVSFWLAQRLRGWLDRTLRRQGQGLNTTPSPRKLFGRVRAASRVMRTAAFRALIIHLTRLPVTLRRRFVWERFSSGICFRPSGFTHSIPYLTYMVRKSNQSNANTTILRRRWRRIRAFQDLPLRRVLLALSLLRPPEQPLCLVPIGEQ